MGRCCASWYVAAGYLAPMRTAVRVTVNGDRVVCQHRDVRKCVPSQLCVLLDGLATAAV